MHDIAERITNNRVVVIYRGLEQERCTEASLALYEAGLRSFEVTLTSKGALGSISELKSRLPSDAAVGAGTVLTIDEVNAAKDAGAEFIISPDCNESVIEQTRSIGLVSIPGAFTPTEVLRAARSGAHIVKVFPVRSVGPDYLRQLRGPIPDVSLLVSGGVNAQLAAECFAAGAQSAGVGLHLFGAQTESHEGWFEAGQRFLKTIDGAS